MNAALLSHQRVVDETRAWLEKAVIGLNLCPFAKAVYVKNQIHYVVSTAGTRDDLLSELRFEIDALLTHDPADRETTLLMTPLWLHDFLDFTGFLRFAERLLVSGGFSGTIQLASFHPDYQFADAPADDITNFSNRAPFPTLHLLREASVERAVAAFPQPEAIYETNKTTLRRLGHAGWERLGVGRS